MASLLDQYDIQSVKRKAERERLDGAAVVSPPRVHCRALHIGQVKPGLTTAAEKRLVDPHYRLLVIPLIRKLDIQKSIYEPFEHLVALDDTIQTYQRSLAVDKNSMVK